MSTIYIIKDGIIVDRRIGYSSYRDSRGETYKPRTIEEERELLQFSENNIKIRELKAELDELKKETDFSGLGMEYAERVEEMFESVSKLEHQKFCPGELRSIMDRWDEASRVMADTGAEEAVIAQAVNVLGECMSLKNKIVAETMKWTENFNAALEKIKTLRGNAEQLEELMFRVETSEGTEEFGAEVDLRTKGALSKISCGIKEISEKLAGSNGAEIEEILKQLDKMERELAELPKDAQNVFTVQIWREEQAQNTAYCLEQAGWKIKSISQGEEIFDDLYMLIENTCGNKAAIIFSINGETRIESFFGENDTLHGLQLTVLDALVKGGAKNATGHCMKGQEQWESHSTEQTEQRRQMDGQMTEEVKWQR